MNLKAIQERAEKATPGPWTRVGPGDGWGSHVAVISPDPESASVVGPQWHRRDSWESPNFDFIAHARTDIPALLEHIARQDEVVRMPTEALSRQVSRCRCRGSGRYVPTCHRCHDSTDDHECSPAQLECRDTVCAASRAALKAASEGRPSNG